MKGVEMLLAPMVEIFCDIDDFCKHHEENKQLKLLLNAGIKKRDRKPQLSMSEIMTLLIFFHLALSPRLIHPDQHDVYHLLSLMI